MSDAAISDICDTIVALGAFTFFAWLIYLASKD